MKERYFEANTGSEAIDDLIEKNVISALTNLIDDGGAWLEIKDGKLHVTFHSFEMPSVKGKPQDIWHKNFDLFDMAMEIANTYDSGRELSKSQREELEEFAVLLEEVSTKFRSEINKYK